ncbi:MAG: gamma-glutamyl-gamma-aminobutyrate hydrolase family protein [Gemmatimonadetes bacterium]|nr:gamma-glutamyl-gamma-aminobutyrate hydrolase family protein [Gemmatimonadota bacterium]
MIERFRDYDAWFRCVLEPAGVDCRVYALSDGQAPDPGAADGWIVTGARSSIADKSPLVDGLLEWIRTVVDRGAPLLGVCYGHQAIAAALGGSIELHPGGWELGTVEVELTEEGRRDPLFAGFPDRFLVQATHADYVVELPSGGVSLASNAHTAVQALAVGESCRGIQFHAEVTTEISRDFVARRGHLVNPTPVVTDAPLATRVLTNFVERFVRTRVRS